MVSDKSSASNYYHSNEGKVQHGWNWGASQGNITVQNIKRWGGCVKTAAQVSYRIDYQSFHVRRIWCSSKSCYWNGHECWRSITFTWCLSRRSCTDDKSLWNNDLTATMCLFGILFQISKSKHFFKYGKETMSEGIWKGDNHQYWSRSSEPPGYCCDKVSNVNMKDVLWYELSTVPLSTTHIDGTIRKTN